MESATLDQTMTVKVPSKHYSQDPDEALFFYGGPFSNFVTEMGGNFGDKKLFVYAHHIWYPGGGSHNGWRGQPERVAYGAEYRTVEHFFQASKALDYDDHEWVRDAWRPQEAKQRGRKVDLRSDWDDVKLDYMLVGLRAKFAAGSLLANMLLATGDRFIAEDSPTDDVWGIRDRDGGFTGENLLGKALMMVRRELRERQEQDERLAGHLVTGLQAVATLEANSHAEAD